MADDKSRREYLVALGTVGVASLAGCESDVPADEATTDQSTEGARTTGTDTRTATTDGTETTTDRPTDGARNTDTDTGTTGTADGSDQQVTASIQVVSSTGTDIENAEIGTVEMTLSLSPGSADVDLRDVSAEWTDPSGTYTVAAAESDDTASADGTFGVDGIVDENDSMPVLDAAEDRAVVTFALGTSDSDIEAFGEPLGEGEAATVEFTTSSGDATTARLVVPETISGEGAVAL